MIIRWAVIAWLVIFSIIGLFKHQIGFATYWLLFALLANDLLKEVEE